MSEQKLWIWKGEKEFVPGVPARNMEHSEVLRRGVLALVQESPLFVEEIIIVDQSEETGEVED